MQYFGQAIGLIVAESKVQPFWASYYALLAILFLSVDWLIFVFDEYFPYLSSLLLMWQRVADEAASLVAVEYTDLKTPILTIDDAIAANSFFNERGIEWAQGKSYYYYHPCF